MIQRFLNFVQVWLNKRESMIIGFILNFHFFWFDIDQDLVSAKKRRSYSSDSSNSDIIVIDTAHGHSKQVIETVERIKKLSNAPEIVAGNIATPEAAKFLLKLGVDIIKVGIGPGSICTTRLVAGIGVPQLSAILSVRNGIKNKNVKIISDGGIKYSGDLAKAFAAGADAVMIGSLFAGTDETPGRLIKRNGRYFKSFRGIHTSSPFFHCTKKNHPLVVFNILVGSMNLSSQVVSRAALVFQCLMMESIS